MGESRKYRKFTRAAEDRDRARVAARPEDDRASSAASTTSPRACCASGASSSSRPAPSALRGKAERTEADELRRQIAPARAGAGAQDDGGRGRGGTLAGLGVSMRVARSRELVAQGRPAALVARVAGISRQAIYRRPKRGRRGPAAPAGRGRPGVLARRARRTRPTAPGWSPRSPRARARPAGEPQARAAADARASPAAAHRAPRAAAGGPATSRSRAPTSSGTWT